MPVLTVQNALVRSAAVEVKTLTVSGRQITQALFRQVPYQAILGPRGELNGPPWGWVNYWWPDAPRWGEDPLHVLWQHGGELRRACVPKPSMWHARHWNEGYKGWHYGNEPVLSALGDLDKEAGDLLDASSRHSRWNIPPFRTFGASSGWEEAAVTAPPRVLALAFQADGVLDAWQASYDTCKAAGQLFIAC
jgi:hypothetical protein